MALDWMHMRYCSGVSSSAHCFSCHRWKRPDTGVRITIRSLRRYFLYKWTSSTPQPLTSRSNPPERSISCCKMLGQHKQLYIQSIKSRVTDTYQCSGNPSDTGKSFQSQNLSRIQHLFCESNRKNTSNICTNTTDLTKKFILSELL